MPIVVILLTILGPVLAGWLKQWLDSLLTATAAKMINPPADHQALTAWVAELHDRARATTYVWQFIRRSTLESCRRVALARIPELAAGRARPLTAVEASEF